MNIVVLLRSAGLIVKSGKVLINRRFWSSDQIKASKIMILIAVEVTA